MSYDKNNMNLKWILSLQNGFWLEIAKPKPQNPNPGLGTKPETRVWSQNPKKGFRSQKNAAKTALSAQISTELGIKWKKALFFVGKFQPDP